VDGKKADLREGGKEDLEKEKEWEVH